MSEVGPRSNLLKKLCLHRAFLFANNAKKSYNFFMNKDKRIYLDHSATTYLDPKVKKAMESFFSDVFGNPSSIYEEGREAKKAISEARLKVAQTINAHSDEIIFTGGGTESDNLAIFGIANSVGSPTSNREGVKHIITSKIEHHAVLHACERLEKSGWEITYLNVDKNGIVDLKQLKESLRKETVLVSIMYANNEIGAIQPIREIAKIIRNFKKSLQPTTYNLQTPLIHTDAVQAPAYLDLNVLKLGVDLMTLNGSKIYGPKGVGMLYKKRGIKIDPMVVGGGQEMGLRSGTENVSGIVGFGEALELVQKNKEKESKRLIGIRDYFIDKLLKTIPNSVLNGSREDRLPNNVNISVRGVEGEAMVLYLDAKGVACSTGSACTSDSLEPSHVIRAIGMGHEYAHGSLRFTMGKETTKKEVDYVLKILPDIILKLKGISSVR